MIKFYKIRDKVTGLFYSGRGWEISKVGKAYQQVGHARSALTNQAYIKRWAPSSYPERDWEIVIYEAVEKGIVENGSNT